MNVSFNDLVKCGILASRVVPKAFGFRQKEMYWPVGDVLIKMAGTGRMFLDEAHYAKDDPSKVVVAAGAAATQVFGVDDPCFIVYKPLEREFVVPTTAGKDL